MPSIQLQFKIALSNMPESDSEVLTKGYPSNEADALTLKTKDDSHSLQIWFDATAPGYIVGSLEYSTLSDQELSAIKERKINDPDYIAAGKKIVKLIQEPVSRLERVMRIDYRLAWVEELPKWDSRQKSLRAYCQDDLSLQWTLDKGATWRDFLPDEYKVSVGTFLRLSLTKRDKPATVRAIWNEIEQAVNDSYEPPLPLQVLAGAYQLREQDKLKHALIDAVTALEIALDDYIRNNAQGTEKIEKLANNFSEGSSIPAKALAVLRLTGKVTINELDMVLKAVTVRNDIVHKGAELPENASKLLDALLRATDTILPGLKFTLL